MTGYSGTPLAKKLGIKQGHALLAVDAPENYADLLSPLPDDVMIVRADARKPESSGTGELDMVHFFANSRDDLFRGLAKYKHMIRQDGVIWVSWYKKAAGLPTEITEDTVREAALPIGLVDIKVCAVDERWSGLKLVIRKENRL
jgi:hypothetical protein